MQIKFIIFFFIFLLFRDQAMKKQLSKTVKMSL